MHTAVAYKWYPSYIPAMSRTRTTVMLDEELVVRARKMLKADSVSDVLEVALKELLRRESLRQLAAALGSPDEADQNMVAPPRRRPA